MKARVLPKSHEAMLQRYDCEGPVKGWYFRVREITNGSYRAEGADRFGRTVGRSGDDPAQLIALCEEDARVV